MISLCAPTFDIDGQLLSPSGIALQQPASRRSELVPVLDLAVGAVLVDGGWSPTDLKYKLETSDLSPADFRRLFLMVATYPTLILSCEDGCFLALLSRVNYRNGQTTALAEVLEDLS